MNIRESENPVVDPTDLIGENAGGFEDGAAAENPWVSIPDGIRYAILLVVSLYAGICGFLALAHPEQNAATPLLVLSSVFYLGMLVLPLVVYDDEKHGWFHPLIFLSLKVLILTIPRRTPLFLYGLTEHAVLQLSVEELTTLVAYENFLLALALLATYAGYTLVRQSWMPRLRIHPAVRLPPAIVASALITSVALVLLIGLSGSFSQHFLNLSLNVSAKVFEGDATAYTLISVFVGLLATALVLLLAYRPQQIRRPLFWILALLALGAIYLATGKRSHVVNPVLLGAVTWMLTVGRVPLFRLLLAGAVVFVAFSFMSVIRGASTNAGSLEEVWARADFNFTGAAVAQGEEFNARAGSYNSLYPILHYVPEQSPLLWGETYLTILLRPIPRALMPSKPRGTDFRAGVEFFNATWGVPPGPIGEAFWNFHIPGVIVVFFLTGAFYRWLVDFYRQYRGEGIVTVLYVTVLNGFSPTENVITLLMHAFLVWLILAYITGALRLSAAKQGMVDDG